MRRWSVLCCACLLLSGCGQLPQAREMGDMALLRTMAVDRDGDGVAVAVSTGPRARGLEGEQEAALTLTAREDSLSAAALSIQKQSGSYVFFGYVDQLLLGEGLAEESILPVLEYFSRSTDLSLGAGLWIVRDGAARAALESGEGEAVERRLATLRTDGRMGVSASSRTAQEVYADMLELGCAYVPALAPGDGTDASLKEDGFAVLKDGALAGFLDGDAARGLELLSGKPEREAVEFRLRGERTVVEITGARTAALLVRQGWRPETLELACRVEARLAERGGTPGEADRKALEEALAARELERIGAALSRLKAWRADCVGLGGGENWNEQFGQMEIHAEVEVEIRG